MTLFQSLLLPLIGIKYHLPEHMVGTITLVLNMNGRNQSHTLFELDEALINWLRAEKMKHTVDLNAGWIKFFSGKDYATFVANWGSDTAEISQQTI
jgi:hypothetical protein